ncbi:LysR substrate-binding domain-containing protein [Pandoraea apista]|uniref:LysR family transcriptional regulator n=1 Tax=Pandoraea apista TaxID=93218 RepID=A0ABX9ZV28_9BURK|nr:LysR substrate-binding domain-containing protein [Pandoraea apista]ALS64364.1 LysR family transcriptional regulator [Pandoraea apista]AVF40944.1 LysR family transcriptional regulator [Pandoraea apista]OXS88557.1 LysR family transcriptional regulator [Pandoraea apista]PTE02011.1 LysR family transcriptional regulator [Pandoraea apista]RRJ32444.1 LysR family transcriptional regulator [Pandoraea apista]
MKDRSEANTLSASLDIDLLRSFVAIAQAGSLSRAAQRIARTQSALSQQMKRLEAIVDQPLLQRTGRGVVLTNPGERLLGHAQRILRSHDEAMADMSGRGLSGTLRFGCPDDYAAAFLPHLLREFAVAHPQALVEVICEPTPRLLEQLKRHALDLALISLPEGVDEASVIRREPLVWIGNPGLETLLANPVAPLPLALSDPDTLDYIAACEALTRAGRAYRVAYASSNLSGLTALARSGQALAVMTQTAVPADLRIVTGDTLPTLPSVGITVKFDRARPNHLSMAFAEHIRQTLAVL